MHCTQSSCREWIHVVANNIDKSIGKVPNISASESDSVYSRHTASQTFFCDAHSVRFFDSKTFQSNSDAKNISAGW